MHLAGFLQGFKTGKIGKELSPGHEHRRLVIKKLMLPSQSRGLLKAQLQVSSQDWLPNLRSQCKMKCRDPCSKSRKEVLLREVKYYVFLLLQSLSLFLSLSCHSAFICYIMLWSLGYGENQTSQEAACSSCAHAAISCWVPGGAGKWSQTRPFPTGLHTNPHVAICTPGGTRHWGEAHPCWAAH